MVKKQIIMENALELFAKQGFEATSIQQITEKSGISKGAFYLSFKSKDALIFYLLDTFFEEILSKYEQLVISEKPSNILYKYCFFSLENIQQNQEIAHIFIKEAATTFKPGIIERLESFGAMITNQLKSIIQKKFPDVSNEMHSELVFVMNALLKGYAELLFRPNNTLQIDLACRSIEEKISILAQQIQIFSLTGQSLSPLSMTKEQVQQLLHDKLLKVNDQLISESLKLLSQHIDEGHLQPAIVHGLILNLSNDLTTKHLAYILHLYFQISDS